MKLPAFYPQVDQTCTWRALFENPSEEQRDGLDFTVPFDNRGDEEMAHHPFNSRVELAFVVSRSQIPDRAQVDSVGGARLG
ncbi:MAG: hypothetical protein U1G07_07460 [Verrucomicrobiota bacterium]